MGRYDLSHVQRWLGRPLVRAAVVPAIALLVLTGIFRWTELDLVICRMFHGGGAEWPFFESQPWTTLYDYGTFPGMVMGLAGVVIALVAVFFKGARSVSAAGLFLGLALLIGPGLLVNAITKPNVARPRPNEVQEFGGPYEFVRVGDFGWADHTRSFPSGHASMGFYLMVPAFVLFRRYPRAALGFLILGLATGGFIGVGRVVQGRHFASDILWSAGMVYFSGLGLAYLFGYLRSVESEQAEIAEPVILRFPTANQDEAERRRAA